MSPNHTFRRALLSLSHPLSIGAIVLLLFNDHIWRRVAPSWITGKIGDFAWLIFAPFLLAAILAWLIPFRVHRRDEWIGHASIIITGLIFGLAKTVPAFHTMTINVLEFLTGWPNILRMDPTDLIALPALSIAWWIWEQSAARSIRLPDRGWVLLPLAVLATMADSPAPDYGICGFKVAGSAITVRQFTSQDGGLTWQGNNGGYGNFCQAKGPQWQLIDPLDERIRYRFTSGVSIERSSDGGQSWAKEIDLSGDDARASYIEKTDQLFYSQSAGPVDAVIQQPTGNIVVAMGYEGALVRTPDGVWHWVAIGAYHVPDLHRVDNVVVLLSGELLYALALLALALGTLARRTSAVQVRDVIAMVALALGWAALVPIFVLEGNVNVMLSVLMSGLLLIGLSAWTHRAFITNPRRARMRETLRIVLVGIAWLGWIMAVVLFPPAQASGYSSAIPVMATLAVALFAVPMMLGQLSVLIGSNRRALMPTVLVAVLASVLYMLPYIVWSQGGIPFYGTAMLYALALVAGTLIAGRLYLRRFLNEPSTLITDRTTANEAGGTA